MFIAEVRRLTTHKDYRKLRARVVVAFVYGEKEEKETPPKTPLLRSVLTAY